MSGAIHALESQLQARLQPVVLGMEAPLRTLVIALVARGHVLLQGVPGLGKTLLAKTLASALGGTFRRIQGTPDLMPADIIGVQVFDERQRSFVFRPGPLFADVVLMDEINRAGPKTQAALLEAMEERQVTVDGQLLELPLHFLVLATQNPREFEGTYPLPESQLDRFMLRIDLDYPERSTESEVLQRYGRMEALAPGTATTANDDPATLLSAARIEADGVHISEALSGYVLDIAQATRRHPQVALGLSTRGAVALLKAARVMAALDGRDFATPDDVKGPAAAVLAHRLVLMPEASLEGISELDIVRSILGDTAVPR